MGVTLFAAMVRDYVRLHELGDARPNNRLVALMGDAELDEGNVFEALLEGWKHDVRNLWWVIDYNRQSLDGVVHDYLFQRIKDFFGSVGWNVIELKYGKLQEAAFKRPGGAALRDWIDNCPNQLYSALTFQGGAAWRSHLETDIGNVKGIKAILDDHDDDALHRLMTKPGRPRHGSDPGGFRVRRRRRHAPLLRRLHDQGFQYAAGRTQGQPFRSHEPRPDGGVQGEPRHPRRP